MTLKQDILKRLLDEKLISFEEMMILNEKEKEYIYNNIPSVSLPYIHVLGMPAKDPTITTYPNPYTITSTSTTAEVK